MGILVGVHLAPTKAVAQKALPSSAVQKRDYAGILVYSPTCPHCENLRAYLQKKYPNAPILETTDAAKIQPYLDEANVNWQGGVPIMAIDVNGKIYVISGFPAKFQDKNGYINGKEWEEGLCRGVHGTFYPSDKNYLFCIRPDGEIIGNEHAIDWIMSKIKG